MDQFARPRCHRAIFGLIYSVIACLVLSGCSTTTRQHADNPNKAAVASLRDIVKKSLGTGMWKLDRPHEVRISTIARKGIALNSIDESDREIFTHGGFDEIAQAPPMNIGPVWVAEYYRRGFFRMHTFRKDLPENDIVLGCNSAERLIDLLGPSQGFREGSGGKDEFHSSVSWAYFSLDESGAIETLSVFALTIKKRQDSETSIEGLLIRRGKEAAIPSETSLPQK